MLQAAGAGVPVGGVEPEGGDDGANDTLGLAPTLSEGVGVAETVCELEQVGTSAVLPTGQDEGQPHAAHVAIDVAPRAALNVPAAHSEGVAELFGQKEPAGHADVVMV